MSKEFIYLGNANTIDRALRADGVVITALQMAAITRASMTFGSTVIDSDATDPSGVGAGSLFDCTTRADEGVIILDLSGETITPDIYVARLTIYDASNLDGFVWDTFTVQVLD